MKVNKKQLRRIIREAVAADGAGRYGREADMQDTFEQIGLWLETVAAAVEEEEWDAPTATSPARLRRIRTSLEAASAALMKGDWQGFDWSKLL